MRTEIQMEGKLDAASEMASGDAAASLPTLHKIIHHTRPLGRSHSKTSRSEKEGPSMPYLFTAILRTRFFSEAFEVRIERSTICI